MSLNCSVCICCLALYNQPHFQHREKITYWEGGQRVTAALPFVSAVDTLLKVALTEHRTDTKINPSGTKTLEVVLTQNRSVFSVILGSDGCYIFLPFHYSFFFQPILSMVRGAVLICIPFKLLLFSVISVILLYLSLSILSGYDTTVIQQSNVDFAMIKIFSVLV